jgi:hypothetical protein
VTKEGQLGTVGGWVSFKRCVGVGMLMASNLVLMMSALALLMDMRLK